MNETPDWLLLIHLLPAKPDYLRVKVWRRLQGLGAVAVKNSVYVLPSNDRSREDFQWLQKEIEEMGGEASICEARFVDGISDAQIRQLFNAARDGDYAQLVEELRDSIGIATTAVGLHQATGNRLWDGLGAAMIAVLLTVVAFYLGRHNMALRTRPPGLR